MTIVLTLTSQQNKKKTYSLDTSVFEPKHDYRFQLGDL